MIEDLIIIIPTHNRQHYLDRVIRYYSSFPCRVFICDSSKERAIIENLENITYRWVPKSNFYQKVLDVIRETSAGYYALSPDDDFLKQETLLECYYRLSENNQYSIGIGKQVFFDLPFKGSFYISPGTNNLSVIKDYQFENREDYIKQFWYNYQNILWSLFRRDSALNAFLALASCNFSNGNFVELLLGIESLRIGDVYISSNGLNYREVVKSDHWGSTTLPITRQNIAENLPLMTDYHSFLAYYKNDTGHAKKCIDFYLEGPNASKRGLKSLIKSIVPPFFFRAFFNACPFLARRKNIKVKDETMSQRISEIVYNV